MMHSFCSSLLHKDPELVKLRWEFIALKLGVVVDLGLLYQFYLVGSIGLIYTHILSYPSVT